MRASSHSIMGLCAWSGVAATVGWQTDLASAGLCLAGALLPDIDHRRSWLGRRTGGLAAIIGIVHGHRGFTHSLLATVLLASALSAVQPLQLAFVAAVVTGQATHVLGDWMTDSGVKLLWPLDRRYRCPITIRTGGLAERLVVLTLAVGVFAISSGLVDLGTTTLVATDG